MSESTGTLREAAEYAVSLGCGCTDANNEGWHSKRCHIPRLKAALNVVTSGGEQERRRQVAQIIALKFTKNPAEIYLLQRDIEDALAGTLSIETPPRAGNTSSPVGSNAEGKVLMSHCMKPFNQQGAMYRWFRNANGGYGAGEVVCIFQGKRVRLAPWLDGYTFQGVTI